ncbi:MAG: S-layer protein [Paenibacillaceae bacterium]|nr:S-layer protein [Paenibacillaceae bacterium]
MKKRATKAVIVLLTASMTLGAPAMAAITDATTPQSTVQNVTTKPNLKFTDVPMSHWANKYITKLALLGIVDGKSAGVYDPSSSVTQEEVITMLVRMLGLEQAAGELPAFASDLLVSDYAKKYLFMALEKGIILYPEESSTSGTAWGTREASREWVAKLVIRAIGKQAEANELAGQTTRFGDDADISASTRGFINEAVALKIVDGLDDGTFKPAKSVTRAEMATFLSRTSPYMDSTDISGLGIVESATDKAVVLSDDYGDQKTFTFTADTVFYGYNQSQPATTQPFKQGNKLFIVVKNANVVYAEVVEENGKSANVLEGTLVNLDFNTSQIVMKSNGKEITAQIQIPLSIVDKDGKGLASSDMVPGSVLELHRTGSKAKYTSITVKHIPLNKTAEGVIQSVNQTDKKITILETDGSTATYPMASTVTYYAGTAGGDITAIKAKDKISFVINTDVLTEMTMLAAYEPPSDKGRISDIKEDKSYLYITIIRSTDGKPASYTFDANLKVSISGMEATSFRDLEVDDQVKLLLDDENKVIEAVVTNRALQTEFLNTVVSYDAKNRYLVVKNQSGKSVFYELSDSTVFEMYGSTATFTLGSSNLTEGKKIDILSSSENTVKKISIVYNYQGTIARVSPLARTITLKIGEQYLTLTLGSGVGLVIPNNSNPALTDLIVGEQATIMLDTTSTNISMVEVSRSFLVYLANKSGSNRQLTLREPLNGSTTLTIPYNAKVYNMSGQEIPIDSMSNEEPYFLYYKGSTVEKVQAAQVSRGNLLAVDAAAGKLTISEAGSAGKTLEVGTTAIVKRTSLADATIADLKAGDRVEAVKGQDGVYTIYTATSLTRKTDYYDTATSNLYVLRESLGESRNYPFHSKAYIHQGSISYAPASIPSGKTVTLYLINGKIVEVDIQS